MESQKVDMFLMMNSRFFNPESIPYVKKLMEDAPDERAMMVQITPYKDPYVFLIISIVGGHLGIDRMLLGETGLGIAKLLTCGGLGIWTIVDWFTIMQRTRDNNFTRLQQLLFT
jgi:TM2 domain-containing membrane protein YozV